MSRPDFVDIIQSSYEQTALVSLLYIHGGKPDVAIQLPQKVTGFRQQDCLPRYQLVVIMFLYCISVWNLKASILKEFSFCF